MDRRGELARGLSGVRNVVGFFDGDSVLNHTQVRVEVQREVRGADSVEDSPFSVPEENRCSTGEGISGHRVGVGTGEVVRCGGGVVGTFQLSNNVLG